MIQTIKRPNPKQISLLTCPANEVFFGGSRGGSKSVGACFDWLAHMGRWGGNAIGLLLRTEYVDLNDFLESKAKKIFPFFGGTWKANTKTWHFKNGARLVFGHCNTADDAGNYQGHEYTWICFEEAGLWASPDDIDKIIATQRSSAGVIRRVLYTGNPGGVGHQWLKRRFVTPSRPNQIFNICNEAGKVITTRVFIPSRATDNPDLMAGDPDYLDRILASDILPHLKRAWVYGDWNIVAGGLIADIWDEDVHVIPAFPIPKRWRIDRSFDWGSTAPYSVGWWAEADGTMAPNGIVYPRGTLFRVAEIYGGDSKHHGLKKLNADIAAEIRDYEDLYFYPRRVAPGPADGAIFAETNGYSIAGEFESAGVPWLESDKSPGSRVLGWQQLRTRLANSLRNEGPGLYIFEHCRDTIEQLPNLQTDEKKLEDIANGQPDHIADEVRYRLLSPGSVLQIPGLFSF